VIYFDSETFDIPNTDPVVMGLRLWCATLDDRRPDSHGRQTVKHGHGHTPEGLADFITTAAITRKALWIYAHNLGFDLSTTRLLQNLVAAGWGVVDASLQGHAPWFRLELNGHHLTICDSWSWLPQALAAIGAKVGVRKPPLPGDDDGPAEWLARCQADVAILATAVNALMDWWDKYELGRWSITGTACGWNAFRHMPSPQSVIIDPDEDAVKFDRRAIYGGRRSVWRVGTMTNGPYLELDIVAAHPTVAAYCALPRERRSRFESLPVDSPLIDSRVYGIMAEVEIETDTPRWPMRWAGANWYPIGRFRTVLAGPDIAEAKRLGCLRAVGAGYVHRLGWPMAPWALWVLDVQSGRHPDAPPVARVAAKHWGRAVIGKWAAHGYESVALGPSPGAGWGFEDGWDHDGQCRGGMVDLAGQRFWTSASGEPDNAYPAILAWVESETRVRLSRVIEAVGPGAVLQANTDGLIVAERSLGTKAAGGNLRAPRELHGPARTRWVLDHLAPVLDPLAIRIKGKHKHVTVLGPQHVNTPTGRHFSGLPALATETAPDTYRVRQWPGLTWQLAHGSPAGYVAPNVEISMRGPFAPGWVDTTGRVHPVEATITDAGESVLIPYRSARDTRRPPRLADRQQPALMPLWRH
jgi:hypothetical protein